VGRQGTTLERLALALLQPPKREIAMASSVVDSFNHAMHGEPNLSWTERGVSVVAGLGLAAAAAKPRPNPLLNILALAAGSYLAYRGATGHCPVKTALVENGMIGTDRQVTGGAQRNSRSGQQMASHAH
jgi:hypothetical protein